MKKHIAPVLIAVAGLFGDFSKMVDAATEAVTSVKGFVKEATTLFDFDEETDTYLFSDEEVPEMPKQIEHKPEISLPKNEEDE